MAESLGQASFSTPQKLRGCGEGPCWYNQYACQGGWVWGRGRGEEMWLGPSPSRLGGVALCSLLVGGRGLAVGTPSPELGYKENIRRRPSRAMLQLRGQVRGVRK